MTGKACGNAVRSKAASWRGFAHGADRGKGSGVWKKILDHGEEDCGNTSMKFGVKTATVILFGLCIGCDELVELSPPGTVHRIGEKVTVERLGITVDAVNLRSRVGGVLFGAEASEGGVYVAVDWSYENVSKEPISGGLFSTPDCYLVSPEGTKYNQDLAASVGLAEERDLDEKIVSDLNPGIRVRSACVFEVSRKLLAEGEWRIAVVTSEGQVWVKVPNTR